MQPIIHKSYLYSMPIPLSCPANTKINFDSIQELQGVDIYSLQVITNIGSVANEFQLADTLLVSLTLVKNDIEIIKNYPLSDLTNDLNIYPIAPAGRFWQLPMRMFKPQQFDLTKSYVTFQSAYTSIIERPILFNFIYK